MGTFESTGTASDTNVLQRAAAWGVHLLTASGAIAGLMAVIAISQGRWVACFLWLTVATVIDSCDGFLARLARVKDVLPGFDGALLDNMVDYFTYVIVPALFMYEAGLLPPRLALAGTALMVLASSYQFCQADAKTDDHYFTGFPSYWNVVAAYLLLLGFGIWVNLVIIVALSILVFVPIKYVYPSRTPRYRTLTVVLTIAWSVLMLYALVRYPEPHPALLWASLAYIAYYAAMSLALTMNRQPEQK